VAFAVVQSEVEVLEINLAIAAEELTKFEAVAEDALKSEKTLSAEMDSLAGASDSNQKLFDREKAALQDKHMKIVSVRPALCLTPLTHSSFQLEAELQELKGIKEASDERVKAKLEKVVEEHQTSLSNVKDSIDATASARERKDTLTTTLDSKRVEEDDLFTAIRTHDNTFSGKKVIYYPLINHF
jgi:hypothetical protein